MANCWGLAEGGAGNPDKFIRVKQTCGNAKTEKTRADGCLGALG